MITVFLGVTSVEERIRISRYVTRIIIQPGWDTELAFDTSGNDLALLELNSAITEWSDKIQPVCLPVPDNIDSYRKFVATGKTLEVSGMGVTRSSEGRADIIQRTVLILLTQAECRKGYFDIKGDQHCAIGDEGTKFAPEILDPGWLFKRMMDPTLLWELRLQVQQHVDCQVKRILWFFSFLINRVMQMY